MFTRVIIVIGGRNRGWVRDTQGVSGLCCTIVVSGELGERFDGAFAGLVLTREDDTTRLRGILTDQSEFEGVVRQLFDLGLEVVSIATHPGDLPGG